MEKLSPGLLSRLEEAASWPAAAGGRDGATDAPGGRVGVSAGPTGAPVEDRGGGAAAGSQACPAPEGRDGPASREAGLGPGLTLEGVVRLAQEHILRDHSDLLLGARRDPDRRRKLRGIIARVLVSQGIGFPGPSREALVDRVTSEIVGFGPIDGAIRDPEVTEVMVNGPGQVYLEKAGRLELSPIRFRDEDHLMEVISRIVAPLGRRVDQSSPYVDARLPDGSRVHAIVPPLALDGPALTIRKFARQALTLEDLVGLESLSPEMAGFLKVCVQGRLNLVVSGGAASGKTTTLNALSAFIQDERVITIEDAAELELRQPHVVRLECRPPNLEGRGEVTVRDLVRNALRMRPDRIIVGECRGAEAFDVLQAMNTGHDGSMTTVHANGPRDALSRLENMALTAGEGVPLFALREQMRSALDLVVHQARFRDGSRRVVSICLVAGSGPRRGAEAAGPPGAGPGGGAGKQPGPPGGADQQPDSGPAWAGPDLPALLPVFWFEVTGVDASGKVRGVFRQAPRLALPPRLEEKLRAAGLEPGRWWGRGSDEGARLQRGGAAG
ncbi:MAG: CpaF family protein [Acetobacteraceae bacterium]|nr:CpaF family protein [Acetobacteraceae bacterium]